MSAFTRDPATERLWFSITPEDRDEKGGPDFAHTNACVRHHGGVVAYYGGWNGTYAAAEQCARESIEGRVAFLCNLCT
jgi:hypothetical protein